MGQKQRHNETFKKETVKSIQEQNKSTTQNAEELNISSASTLRKWPGQYRSLENKPLASADITYIPCREGRLYLASVLDLHTHKNVGWCLYDPMTTDLV